MAVEFRLPDLGEGMTEAELMRWLVKPGDHVTLDQPVAQVQTDKAVVELPAPVEGTIRTIDVPEGQMVPVHTLLFTMDEGTPANSTTATEVHESQPRAEPAATAAMAQEPRQRDATSPTSGPVEHDGRWTAASVAPQRRVLATPAVRRLARELGVNIAALAGHGPAGRVLAEDVRAAAQPAPAAAVGEAIPASSAGYAEVPPASPDGATEAAAGTAEEERLPLRGLRRRIAENMLLAVSTMPQITSMIEVDASALVALRRSVLPAAEERGIKLSYLPFVIKALVQALRRYPYVNAAIDDTTKEIVLKHHYDIGIATATPDGLLVPVLRHADRLTVLEIAAELVRLAEAGRARKLPLDELRGSTFSITNFGSVGGYFATPIVNPREAAILGLGRIVDRPWAVDGRVEVRPVLPLSFSADHRLIDGALAMEFLNTLVASLENPNLLLLELR